MKLLGLARAGRTSPQSAVPGTKMAFAGLPDAGQRADVIAYLASISK
jgi:cytochrome c